MEGLGSVPTQTMQKGTHTDETWQMSSLLRLLIFVRFWGHNPPRGLPAMSLYLYQNAIISLGNGSMLEWAVFEVCLTYQTLLLTHPPITSLL